MAADRRRPGDPLDPISPLVDAVIIGPFVALAVVGELWDWARPRASAVALRGLVWLREGDRG